MNFKHIVSAVAVAAAALAAPAANAAFINGGISFTGFFQNQAALTNLPTSMVSTLTAFDVDPIDLAGSGTVAFAGVSGFGTATDFNITSVPQQMFAKSGFSFKILAWGPVNAIGMSCVTAQCTDAISFTGVGEVSKAGFSNTGFTMSWSAQASCNESIIVANTCDANSASASWSASISAPPVKKLASRNPPRWPWWAWLWLALVGLALAGLGFTARRRAAK